MTDSVNYTSSGIDDGPASRLVIVCVLKYVNSSIFYNDFGNHGESPVCTQFKYDVDQGTLHKSTQRIE